MPEPQKRPSFIDNAMDVALTVAKRSEDKYVRVGSVGVAEDGTFISTGYNGLPPGFNLTEEEWNDRDYRRPFVIHSEINSIMRAPRNSIHTMTITMMPCLQCLVAMAGHGVKRIIYKDPYSHESYGSVERTHEIAKRLGIELIKWEEKKVEI